MMKHKYENYPQLIYENIEGIGIPSSTDEGSVTGLGISLDKLSAEGSLTLEPLLVV